MSQLYLKKTLTGFDPSDDHSKDLHRKFKLGTVYRADIVKPRSYKHHCLCLALLNLTFENQDRYQQFEPFRKAVALEAGHVDELIRLNGEIVLLPKSISYDGIPDDIAFGKVMSAMMDVCCNILGDMSLPELQAEVSKYASDHYGIAA